MECGAPDEGRKDGALCAEFGISRKTGYKIYERYKTCGELALTDRSRRTYRQANRLPAQLEALLDVPPVQANLDAPEVWYTPALCAISIERYCRSAWRR